MKSSTDFDTPEQLVEAFCRFLTNSRKSPQTVKDRRGDLLALVRWSEAQNKCQFELNEFATKKFESYQAWLLTRFKDSTVNRRLTSLSLFLNWSIRQKLLDPCALPAIKSIKPKARDTTPELWVGESHIARLLEAVENSQNPDEIAIVLLLATTGLRISDICLLRWEDVDVQEREGTITIAKKTFGRRIQLPINDWGVRMAILSLAESKKHLRNDFVFQRGQHRLTRRAVEMLIKRYSKLAGLPLITPKMLRYSFVMNSICMGISPHEILTMIGSPRLETFKRHFDIF